ncbi:unnamed protein product [Peniophora sp. CBMAI 1063]|nr:unnamed protein product [Peniophora sp. CBMAI 1063]
MYPSSLSILAVLALVFSVEAAPAPNPVFGRSAFPGGLLSRGALRRESSSQDAAKRSDDGAPYVLSRRRDVPPEARSPVLPIPGVDSGDAESALTVDTSYYLPIPDATDAIEFRARHSRDMFHLH